MNFVLDHVVHAVADPIEAVRVMAQNGFIPLKAVVI